MHGKIRVGTASWLDPGFVADWYPKKLPASERLPYYAEHFDLVELNSSFYAIPRAAQVARWCDQTPKGFLFDVKLHKLLSRHSTPPNLLPPDLRKMAEIDGKKVKMTPRLEEAVAKRFLREIEPLEECHKLGALLLQLSPGFSPRSHKLSELEDLFSLLKGKSVAVELRNKGWVTEERLEETEKFFRKHHISLVVVDAPETAHFMAMPYVDLVTDKRLAYMRCHGRNEEGYVRGRSVATRFNYQYSEQELQELAEKAEQLAQIAKETHVIYNNNASDYAIQSAKKFREIIDGESARGRRGKGQQTERESLELVPAN
jgi:uncharacterized protein YecE (DUF72 family)